VAKFVKVMDSENLPIGKSAIIRIGEKEIALFNYKGKYYAVDNKCPHKGAPLGEGRIEECIVICPNHEWRFKLETGGSLQNPELRTNVYPVRTKGNFLYIGLETDSRTAFGKDPSKLPSNLNFNISTVQQPINPDETL